MSGFGFAASHAYGRASASAIESVVDLGCNTAAAGQTAAVEKAREIGTGGVLFLKHVRARREREREKEKER